MRSVFCTTLLSVACLVSATAADDPPAKGPADLQGVWKLVSVEADGTASAPLGGNEPRLVIKGEKVLYGGKELAKLTADASTSPKIMDLKFTDPERVYEGIYAVEKGKLKVCLNRRTDGGKERPDAFATKDKEDRRLLVFEREEKAPAAPTDGLTGFAGIALRKLDDDKGVSVDAPIKGSPAEKSGLKAGDLILKVGETAATDLDTTVNAVRKAKPGTKLDIRVRRGDEEKVVTVEVGVLPFVFVAGLE